MRQVILSLLIISALLFICVSKAVSAQSRKAMWILGDPHLNSRDKGYEICDISTAATKTTDCFTSSATNPSLQIKCFFTTLAAPSAQTAKASLLTTISITFNIGATQSETFTAAADPAVQFTAANAKFVTSGTTTATNTATKATWLSLTTGTGTSVAGTQTSYVLIYDYNSLSTILIYQRKGTTAANSLYALMLYTPSSFATSATSGVLAGGCTSVTTDTTAAVNTITGIGNRRRRALDPESRAAVASCSFTSGSSESTLTASVLNSICTYDGLNDADLASAVKDQLTAMNSAKSADTAVFGAATKVQFATQLGLVLAVLNFAFVFFY